MDKSKRAAVIAGNWKMNKTPSEAAALASEIAKKCRAPKGCRVVICVPFTDLFAVGEAIRGTDIGLGAQNVHFAKSGAYTGEVSADMLRECGVEYVIIGHSERRQYFGETDETVNARTKAALGAGLNVILCVGELLTERELGITEEVVGRQIKSDLFGISAEQMKNVIIAYEPVWAIGTGRTATADQAQEVCAFIRKTLSGLYGEQTADGISIQYGGSMKASNAAELLSKPDVDGGLIGGASLLADDFCAIVNAAE